MISPISDGQPITYDLLNQIINEVNKVNSTYTDEYKQIVQVSGAGIGKNEGDVVVIATGEVKISVPSTGRIPVESITFPKEVGFDSTPYICTTIVDTNRNDSGQGLNAANATIVELSKTKFSVKLQLLKPVDGGTSIKLHYIAIGPGSSA